MKYLITGGAGFIGSHLAETLVARGDQVIILDNFSTGSVNNLDNLTGLVEIKNGSILEKSTVSKLVAESNFIVHLAATLGVLNIINKPLHSLKTNIQGTENVLEFADKFRKPVLIASTSEIYGKNSKVPLNEEDDRIVGHPLKSRWSYSEAKAVDESLAYFYHLDSNLPIRIVRFFNTVGPRQVGNYGMVLPRFINAAKNNEDIIVYGSGSQVRSFCHIDDAIGALIKVSSFDGELFNIGNDEPMSINQLADRVIALSVSNSKIVHVPYEQAFSKHHGDINIRVPDLTKIKKLTGYMPMYKLDDIIKDMLV